METGLSHISTLVVTEDKTAKAVGSGELPVLATPMMMALMENAAMEAVASSLPDGSTTVGGHIESSHIKPSAVGATVSAKATLTLVEGRKLTFTVEAYEGEQLIGKGTHLRFIVDVNRFLSGLGK